MTRKKQDAYRELFDRDKALVKPTFLDFWDEFDTLREEPLASQKHWVHTRAMMREMYRVLWAKSLFYIAWYWSRKLLWLEAKRQKLNKEDSHGRV